MERFFVISGCSGGGKSSLIEALAVRGFAVVREPGRRIVAEELAGDGRALPWVDLEAFARRAIEMATADHEAMLQVKGPIFFDRGLVDALAGLDHLTGATAIPDISRRVRYGQTVFMTPPWPEIYVNDDERRHGLDEGMAEYERLMAFYPKLGYRPVVLPKADIETRIRFILQRVGAY
ncbi:AAA family ATPase [Martelella radicis]|uniref:Putative ATPase n=1 Tax=Martelella radicis TaxID=1397476 RepID=A0A7W6KJH5_9HYPH|nr:AAA family ATPase [Martelella radicis]MBB4121058.1 putative ATPase [Martelella radicis]